MCLLLTQPEGTTFDDFFLKGVYDFNSDGIGVMYAENDVLYTRKMVPKTYEDMVGFYNDFIKGRACAAHWRMKTHGHIDLTNCHPYEVLSEEDGYPLYIMHNGILHTGNKNDATKSDTWHYIKDYLRPMLLKNPEFFMHPAFAEIVGEHISNGNKFVLMDTKGNTVTVNEDQGVTHNGAWLSNTYAWDTTGTEHAYPLYTKYTEYSRPASNGYLSPAKTDISDVPPKDAEPTYYAQSDWSLWTEAMVDFEKTVNPNPYSHLFSWSLLDQFYEVVAVEEAWNLYDAMTTNTMDVAEVVAYMRSELHKSKFRESNSKAQQHTYAS